jgi:hypothetical protein
MPRVISTPSGPVQAITEEEFDQLVEQYRRHSYPIDADKEPACPACGSKIAIVRVTHVFLVEEKYGELPHWEAAAENGDVKEYYRSYCLRCQGQPNPIGPPVIVAGSFYDVH